MATSVSPSCVADVYLQSTKRPSEGKNHDDLVFQRFTREGETIPFYNCDPTGRPGVKYATCLRSKIAVQRFLERGKHKPPASTPAAAEITQAAAEVDAAGEAAAGTGAEAEAEAEAEEGAAVRRSSQIVGVNWNTKDRKWMARHRVNGKVIYLGSHSTEEAAALAVQRYAEDGVVPVKRQGVRASQSKCVYWSPEEEGAADREEGQWVAEEEDEEEEEEEEDEEDEEEEQGEEQQEEEEEEEDAEEEKEEEEEVEEAVAYPIKWTPPSMIPLSPRSVVVKGPESDEGPRLRDLAEATPELWYQNEGDIAVGRCRLTLSNPSWNRLELSA